MAENEFQNSKIYSENDTFDINELAAIDEEITPEFIENLQSKVSKNAEKLNNAVKPSLPNDDSELFEEIPAASDDEKAEEAHSPELKNPAVKPSDIDENVDDNYIKKYKAKINKQEAALNSDTQTTPELKPNPKAQKTKPSVQSDSPKESAESDKKPQESETEGKENKEIENLTSGNILEKPLANEQLKYNESLDYLDNNTKYAKYVIYIAPENSEFMESLTVKERKNLINKILREQDNIAVTKRHLGIVQSTIKHVIIAILTLAITIPAVYITINASLEATINNYRRSQSIFKTLYKEHGKIKTNAHLK